MESHQRYDALEEKKHIATLRMHEKTLALYILAVRRKPPISRIRIVTLLLGKLLSLLKIRFFIVYKRLGSQNTVEAFLLVLKSAEERMLD